MRKRSAHSVGRSLKKNVRRSTSAAPDFSCPVCGDDAIDGTVFPEPVLCCFYCMLTHSAPIAFCPSLPPLALFGRGSKNETYRTSLGIDEQAGAVRTFMVRMLYGYAMKTRGLRHIEEEIAVHHELQEAGIPVIPRFELCTSGTHDSPFIPREQSSCCGPLWICATDLTENGKNYVLSQSNETVDDRVWKKRWAKGEFSSPAPRIRELQQSLSGIAQRTAYVGREFQMEDALFFVVDKQTRETTAVVGDYKHVTKSRMDPEHIVRNNLAVVRNAMRAFKDILGIQEQAVCALFDV